MENVAYEGTPELFTPSRRQKLMAWSTHLFTASSAVWGLLAIIAITNEQWVAAFGWMAAAIFVDSFDGLLARRTRVKEVVPEFDGELLDNIVDYLNYVFVPAYFVLQADLMPRPAAIITTVLILLTSAYQFCQVDAKTDDHYFKGFPSYWNVVVYYMMILGTGAVFNFLVLVLFAVLVFVPIKYIYPSRTEAHRGLTMTLALVWGAANVAILMQFPDHARWLVWISFGYVIYYLGLTLYYNLVQWRR
jgi:phosphatidylcholine synthase